MLPVSSLLDGSFQGWSPLCARSHELGARGSVPPGHLHSPAPVPAAAILVPSPRRVSARGPEDGVAGRVQAWMHEPPSVPGDTLHRRAPGGARGRSGCRRWGAQAAGRQVGFPRCRDPLARGVLGRPRGFLISQPGCPPQDPSPLRGTLGSSLRSPAEGEGHEGTVGEARLGVNS